MKPAVPWSIKGVEPEAREAAKVAARRSGMTLGEWLNTVILDSDDYDPEPAYRPPHRAAVRHDMPRFGPDVHDRLDELSAQIARLARNQSETAVSRVVEPKLDLNPISDMVRGLVDRIERSEKRSINSMEEFDRRLNRLSDKLIGDLSRRNAEPAATPPPDAQPFERALKNIVDHIEQNEQRSSDAFKAVHSKIDGLAEKMRQAPAELPRAELDMLSNIERQLGALAQRIDRIENRGQDPGAVKAIEQKVGHLAEQIREHAQTVSTMAQARDVAPKIDTSSFVSRRELQKIQSRIEDIINKLEDPVFGNPDTAIEQMREEIASLSRNLADVRIESASIKDMQALRKAIDGISTQLSDTTGGGSDESIARMEQEIGALSRSIADLSAGAASARDVEEIRGSLHQVAEQVRQLQAASGKRDGADGARLRREIASINAMITQIREEAASVEDIHALRAALEQLSNQYDPASGEQQLHALDKRIEELAHRLDFAAREAEPGAQQIALLEERLQDLYARLEKATAPSSDDAYRTLESHVATLFDRLSAIEERGAERAGVAGESAQHASALEALERSLEAVQANAAQSDQRTQETLEAVHETLEKVVSRLARLEAAAVVPADAPASTDAPESGEAPEPYRLDTEPHVETDRLDDLRLPPIIGLDDVRPQPEGEPAGPADAVETQRDAVPSAPRRGRSDDFIAAARRAAQASPQSVAGEPKKRSPILNLLSRRPKDNDKGKDAKSGKTRTVLLAAAVALLAIGALSTLPLTSDKPAKPAIDAAGPGEAGAKRSRLTAPETAKAIVRPELPASRDFDKPINPQSLPSAAGTRKPEAAAGGTRGVTEVAKTSVDYAPAAGMPDAGTGTDPMMTGSIPKSAPAIAVPVAESRPAKADESLAAPASKAPVTARTVSIDRTPSAESRPPAVSAPVAGETLPPAEIGPMSLRVAAASGSPAAQFEVAARYSEGRIIAQDFRKAATWYQRAAAKGLAPAQYRLGTLYEKGRGVPADKAAARIWYERAAEKGNRKAMHNLAVLYADTSDGNPNYAKAAMWFRNAAELGLPDSQYNYAVLAERGFGMRADLKEAYRWFSIAKRSGDKGAHDRMLLLEKQLDAADLVTVKLQVESWKPKEASREANVVEIPNGGWGATPEAPETATPAPTPASRQTIADVQTLLNNLGYQVGGADGVLGPRTRDAIRDFERDQGLPPTGMVTRSLLDRLNAQPG